MWEAGYVLNLICNNQVSSKQKNSTTDGYIDIFCFGDLFQIIIELKTYSATANQALTQAKNYRGKDLPTIYFGISRYYGVYDYKEEVTHSALNDFKELFKDGFNRCM